MLIFIFSFWNAELASSQAGTCNTKKITISKPHYKEKKTSYTTSLWFWLHEDPQHWELGKSGDYHKTQGAHTCKTEPQGITIWKILCSISDHCASRLGVWHFFYCCLQWRNTEVKKTPKTKPKKPNKWQRPPSYVLCGILTHTGQRTFSILKCN